MRKSNRLNLPEYFVHDHRAQMQQIVETGANIFDAIVFQPIQEHMGNTNAANLTKYQRNVMVQVSDVGYVINKIISFAHHKKKCVSIESEPLSSIVCNALKPSN